MKRKYDQISPVMEYLHRLPIWERINYKVLLLTYKSLDGLAPQFLSDLLERRPECSTRRDNKNLLVNHKCGPLLSVTEPSRKLHAPDLWNNIPDSLCLSTSIKQLKRGLNTFLCNCVHIMLDE